VAGISKNLKICIAGIPEGVRAAVFDERQEKGGATREIINETANSEWVVQTNVDKSYGGAPVKVVVRCAGFLPYQYQGYIEPGIGLFHAAKLEVDRVYGGDNNIVPENWDSAQEHRNAEVKIQALYRQYRKDNRKARIIKYSLDWGIPIIGATIGAQFGVVGIIIGLAIGYVAGYFSSKLALRAMGLD